MSSFECRKKVSVYFFIFIFSSFNLSPKIPISTISLSSWSSPIIQMTEQLILTNFYRNCYCHTPKDKKNYSNKNEIGNDWTSLSSERVWAFKNDYNPIFRFVFSLFLFLIYCKHFDRNGNSLLEMKRHKESGYILSGHVCHIALRQNNWDFFSVVVSEQILFKSPISFDE